MDAHEYIMKNMIKKGSKISDDSKKKLLDNVMSLPLRHRLIINVRSAEWIASLFNGKPKIYEYADIISNLNISKIEVVKDPFKSDIQREYSMLISKIMTQNSILKNNSIITLLNKETYDNKSFLKFLSFLEIFLSSKERNNEVVSFLVHEIIPFKLHGIEVFDIINCIGTDCGEKFYLSFLYQIFSDIIEKYNSPNDEILDMLEIIIFLIYKELNQNKEKITDKNFFLRIVTIFYGKEFSEKLRNRINILIDKKDSLEYFDLLETLSSFPIIKEISYDEKYSLSTMNELEISNDPKYQIFKNGIHFGNMVVDSKELMLKVNYMISQNIVVKFLPEKIVTYEIPENILASMYYQLKPDIEISYLKTPSVSHSAVIAKYQNDFYLLVLSQNDDKNYVLGISVDEIDEKLGSRKAFIVQLSDDCDYKFISNI